MTSSEITIVLKQLDCSDREASDAALRETFDTCFKLHRLLEETDLSSSGEKFQDTLTQSIKYLENCTKMVNELDLFSSNETVEEISSLNIRYLLLPVLLGNLSMKVQTKNFPKRLEQVQISEMYFKDFLKRCKDYDVSKNHRKVLEELNFESVEEKHQVSYNNFSSVAQARDKKILQYNALKKLNEQEKEMEKYINTVNPDDEVIRKYYLTLCEKWILTAIDELESIKKEKEILQHMCQEKKSELEKGERKSTNPKPKTFAPMIITKNEIQKKVFGAGYPSLPVVSIEDFYKQRFENVVKEHQQSSQGKTLQDVGSGSLDGMTKQEAEDIDTEEKLERDDPFALRKARGWDDWKDDNPRGSGNRKNKG